MTSKSGPDGANFGGIKGADKHCQARAIRPGARVSKHSDDGLEAGQLCARPYRYGAVGKLGRRQGRADVDTLHSAQSKISVAIRRSENGRRIPGREFVVNQYDILTGSSAEDRAYPPGEDWAGPAAKTWNSTHLSRVSSAETQESSGGAWMLYRFTVK